MLLRGGCSCLRGDVFQNEKVQVEYGEWAQKTWIGEWQGMSLGGFSPSYFILPTATINSHPNHIFPLIHLTQVSNSQDVLTPPDPHPLLHTLHLSQIPLIRSIRMRRPRPDCISCSDVAEIGDDLEKVDYEAFCAGASGSSGGGGVNSVGRGGGSAERIGEPVDEEEAAQRGLVEGSVGERISVGELRDILSAPEGVDVDQDGKGEVGSKKVVLVDTRPEVEFGICALPGSISELSPFLSNYDCVVLLCRRITALFLYLRTSQLTSPDIPLERILKDPKSIAERYDGGGGDANVSDLLFICRRGNDSRDAADAIRAVRLGKEEVEEEGPEGEGNAGGSPKLRVRSLSRSRSLSRVRVRDVRGGLIAWSRDVDPEFPTY